ncbi:DUF98 domain-containing protein [Nocardiopsis sp. HNM0947]|uniref:DUF98 domain-containing protein n=1 Tax=Nocardiopsis coralli TaxID=2772213 RepID=A0ABR9P055_9ACTN|nr:chorismate pyruvate-lyase family protein [Nocardiopsis coralli]MBE2997214.1 DUF98 domain-containing protein [Nocardiopsis coralli]
MGRAVLLNDGTLTLLLQHFVGERIVVGRLAQQVVPGEDAPRGPLSRTEGPVLVRDVDLAGEHSARTYVRARSVICLDAVPAAVGEELLSSRTPLGVLLNKHRVGIFRQLSGVRTGTPLEGEGSAWTSRTSFLSMGRVPSITLVEAFPDDVLLDLDAAVRNP